MVIYPTTSAVFLCPPNDWDFGLAEVIFESRVHITHNIPSAALSIHLLEGPVETGSKEKEQEEWSHLGVFQPCGGLDQLVLFVFSLKPVQ